ncbi:MAG TPA: DUF3048 domain-containing protein [Candidatus Dormibacteraeota bacterium]|nr:DUF3048 domain-containing protein [Candidatus Dormibacteraeota bacterium]
MKISPVGMPMALVVPVILAASAPCGSLESATPQPTPGRLAPAFVQVEDAPGSRPHSGLQEADIVYEYLTEGGISRFTAIYWSPSGGFRIEPVRSARLVTLRLVRAYGGVLFYSGASDHVQAQISGEHLPGVSQSSDAGRYFARDRSRAAPHNLYTTGDQLHQGLDRLQVKVNYPAPVPSEPSGKGEPTAMLTFQQTVSHKVAYTYSPADRTYMYADRFGPLVDIGNGAKQVSVTNVVLLKVAHHGAGYTEDVLGAEGIDFDLEGGGDADLYTRGQHFPARWDLSHGPMRLLGADGKPMRLPPGLTWIHLVDPDTHVQTA